MIKNHRIVMAPSATGVISYVLARQDSIILYEGNEYKCTAERHHLYAISDEVGKVGDWLYDESNNEVYQMILTDEDTSHSKKIIATTDKQLRFNSENGDPHASSVPQHIVSAYIGNYNNGSKITEIAVIYSNRVVHEMTNIGPVPTGAEWVPFIDTEGVMNIVLKQEDIKRDYSLEDMRKAFEAGDRCWDFDVWMLEEFNKV